MAIKGNWQYNFAVNRWYGLGDSVDTEDGSKAYELISFCPTDKEIVFRIDLCRTPRDILNIVDSETKLSDMAQA